AVIVLGLFFLVAAVHNPGRTGSRIYAALVGTAALAGAGIAAWHLRVQAMPPGEVYSCGPGLSYWLETLPLSAVLRNVFLPTGQCSDIDWTFLGLAMPGWVLICCLTLGALGVWNLWRAPAGARASHFSPAAASQ